jgi:23S rRNA maturation-related 3'-5' exoribonuclease YhaM
MMIGRLIAILFLSRELAHRDHLKTTSYAQHIALNEFYDSIVDLADKLTEAYQGRHGIIEIPLLKDETPKSVPADMLQNHMDMIEKIRYTAIDKADTPIQNIVDEVVGQYLSTLYKLRNLK